MTTSHPATDTDAAVAAKKRPPEKKNNPAALLPLFLVTLAAGLAVLVWGHRSSFLQDFDVSCVRAATPSKDRIYDLEPEDRTITSRRLTVRTDRARKFHTLEITDDPGQIYEATPPSPLDYAVMLHRLRSRGVENIVLTTRMSWDGQPGLSAAALSDQLAAFGRATISLPLTRGATAQELPAVLNNSLIPLANASGNQNLIPAVNQVALPSVLSGGGHIYAGFSRIESIPESGDFLPLLCLWENKGLIPSVELLALMNAYDVTPAEIIVRCGKHIRLGPDGPVVPINSYGEILLPESAASELERVPSTRAEDLITRPDNTRPTTADPNIYLVHAVGEKTSATNTLSPRRLAAIVTWSKNLPAPEPGQSIRYRRLPVWADIVILVDIALAACWFAGFSRGGRHLAFALTAALLFPLLLSLMDITQHWISVSAPLAAVLTAWLVPVKKRKQTTPLQEYHTGGSKPVLRA